MVTRLLRLDDYSSSTSAANSFETINCPAGTDPVADSATDTLNLTSAGGTVTITGTAATDTVNFEVAVPAGNSFSTIVPTTGTSPVADSTADTLTLLSGDGSVAITGSSGADSLDFSVVGKQPLDATLTALAAYNTNGLLTQTAADTFTGRTIVTATSGVTITNGSGVAGNPSIDVADASSILPGLVSIGNQTWSGRKSFNGSVVMNANLNYAWTQDAAATGANANLTNHPTVGVEVTNASLTSVAKLDSTSTSAGHMIIVRNKTGAAITIVNEVDVSGDQIVTGTGANVTLANNASMTFVRDRTASFWAVTAVSSGVTAHSALTGLTSGDDHTQYFLLSGRSGGSTAYGGTGSGDDLTLRSTSHATKGNIFLGTASTYDEVNDRFGMGTLSPAVKIHQDGGNATATYHKFTAGTTTGTTSTDGFDIGIDSSGNGEFRQRENLPITFYTNNTARAKLQALGRLTVGDTTEASGFFVTDTQLFMANYNNTHVATSFAEVIQILAVSSLDLTPSADTNSGYDGGAGTGYAVYAAQGFTADVNGANDFNGGLPLGGFTLLGTATSVVGAFGQVNVLSSGTVDGVIGLLCTAAHQGGGATADYIVGGDFVGQTDTATSGTVAHLWGGHFNAFVTGITATEAISAVFEEPAASDVGLGLPATPTNRCAIWARGTVAIKFASVTSAASITNMACESSHIRLTGSTATSLHGVHADLLAKHIWILTVGAAVTLKHQSATDGTAANRIICKSGADTAYAANTVIELIYDDTQSRWQEV